MMTFLVPLQRHVGEPSRLVGTHWTPVNSLRLVMIHHVLLQQRWRSKDLSADVARRLSNAVNISHVIEKRSLGRAHFRANVTLINGVFGLADTVEI